MIVVERPAPLLTVQDRGRVGYLADGVTRSGPLDALALAVGNALVGNHADAAALEGCLGGASFRGEADFVFALTGCEVAATLNSAPVASYAVIEARARDVLTIERVVRGAVWYLALRGGVDVAPVLGSRSTLLAAGLGGANGAPLKAGYRVQGSGVASHAPITSGVPHELRTPLDDAPIPLCAGPRSDALSDRAWDAFYRTTFTVSRAVSRVGYRLEGESVVSRVPADVASEPACAGAMQLPPEGQPIVLMADFPTIGGYPIIGVVPAHALGAFAQRAPGTAVRFRAASIDAALAATHHAHNALSQWASCG